MKSELKELFIRDLNILIKEIEQYPNEHFIWLVPTGINNSAGTLALHLAGNLNHFIGAILGDTGYVRNREAEFSDRDVPRAQLIDSLQATLDVVSSVLTNLNDSSLDEKYPIDVFGDPMTTAKFLIHLHGHLTYHLGQVNYHRRLLAHP
ncbi:DinB family protein [Marinoscillum sp.]|uniref:DinB family protein n=1 Tax=Marinoscillum sp. TaxID=2024838 RepID=UPI003BAA5B5F